MKKILSFIFSAMLIVALTACGDDSKSSSDGGPGVTDPFANANNVKDAVDVTLKLSADDPNPVTFTMIYVKNIADEVKLYGVASAGSYKNYDTQDPESGDIKDAKPWSVDRKFFMARTEVTNELYAKVLDWAFKNNKITVTADTSGSETIYECKYGDYLFVKLPGTDTNPRFCIKTTVDGSGNVTGIVPFSDEKENAAVFLPREGGFYVGGYRNAIIFCNLLTEMVDGNDHNVVYGDLTNANLSAAPPAITIDNSKTGFRLPSKEEWLYAAAYCGKEEDYSAGNPAPDYCVNSTMTIHINSQKPDETGNDKMCNMQTLTEGYYWTPMNYVSGGTAPAFLNYQPNNMDATVAPWCVYGADMSNNEVEQKQPNFLGIYDMSGNAGELLSEFNKRMGGAGHFALAKLFTVGYLTGYNSSPENQNGIRLVKTVD